MMLLFSLLACAALDHDEQEDPLPSASTTPPKEVVLDPGALANAGISVALAVEGRLPRTLDIPGTLALNPTREARVGAPVAGQVGRILVQPGDPVSAGATLATIRSPEIADARAAWSAATSQRAAALARRDRTKLLLADGVASQAQLFDAEAAFAEADGAEVAAGQKLSMYGIKKEDSGSDAPLRSAVAGEVLAATATVGAFVTPDQVLFHIGNLDTLVLLLAIPDSQLGGVMKGQSVTFLVDGQSDGPFFATVDAVGAWVDPASRTVNVRATAPNPGHHLRPNQFAKATIVLGDEAEEVGVLLPADAVQVVDGHDVVFVAGETGHFVPRNVDVGARAGDRVRLEGGVAAGESVVVTGAYTLKGQLVKGDLGGDDD